MQNIELLAESLEYIESHLHEDIRTDVIARECACSRSTLEKMFRYVYRISVHDYIVKRRMMKAAKLLYCEEGASILDIALECGYSSNEAFTRAFKSTWHLTPSEFKVKNRESRMPELFPRLGTQIMEGDGYMMHRMKFDISELYDLFKERKGCYIICCDIREMIKINEISRKAGDVSILTALDRMNEAAGADDIVFRIGGDEFCMLTGSKDPEYAESIVRKILARNEQTFTCEGIDAEIPLTLYAAKTMLDAEHNIRYRELFTELHMAILDSKKEYDRQIERAER